MLSSTIKEATKSAHQQLEVVVIKKLKAIRSKADYADLLKHFYAYFSKVEQAVAPYINSDVLADHATRRNSAYLKQDIEALGFDTTELPHAQAPQIDNVQAAMGALYVMEGSVMGGKIIVQMLGKAGITEGLSFFSGYGEETGRVWTVFIEALDSVGTTGADIEAAIAAANKTFSQFEKTFETTSAA